jgi:hypothetical protein
MRTSQKCLVVIGQLGKIWSSVTFSTILNQFEAFLMLLMPYKIRVPHPFNQVKSNKI